MGRVRTDRRLAVRGGQGLGERLPGGLGRGSAVHHQVGRQQLAVQRLGRDAAFIGSQPVFVAAATALATFKRAVT